MRRSPPDFDELQALLWSFGPHRVLTVAARTGILARLTRGAATPETVAAELGLDPLATAKVARALCAMGLLDPEGDRYQVVPALAPWFAPGTEDDLTPFLEHSHQMYERWGQNLEPWLRGESWDTPPRGPDETRRFGAAMQAFGGQFAKRLAELLDLGHARRMLDVGGGFGHFARALCRANPALSATVLDIPAVVDLVRAGGPDPELGSRLTHVEGDYLASDYGSGYDVVLLANILHQEVAERAAALVRKGATALAPGGLLVAVDFSIDPDQRESLTGTIFSLNMRSFGDVYPESALRGWFEAAHLTDVGRMDLGPHRWVIVGSKPARRDEGR